MITTTTATAAIPLGLAEPREGRGWLRYDPLQPQGRAEQDPRILWYQKQGHHFSCKFHPAIGGPCQNELMVRCPNHFTRSLRNLAREWLSSVVNWDNDEHDEPLWSDFKDIFKQEYAVQTNERLILEGLANLAMKPNERAPRQNHTDCQSDQRKFCRLQSHHPGSTQHQPRDFQPYVPDIQKAIHCHDVQLLQEYCSRNCSRPHLHQN